MNPPFILLIDDDSAFLEVLTVKLGSEGFKVAVAHNGEEGLRLARASSPNLVLLDMKMPGMEGGDVLHAMRLDPTLKNMKVLFLSGLVASDDKQFKIDEKFAISEGALGCVRKTDNLSDIVNAIKNHLGLLPIPQ